MTFKLYCGITLLSLTVITCAARAETVYIYAASSLTNVMQQLIAQYNQVARTDKSQLQLVGVYGSSALLAKQIEAGAPAHLFFSADEAWINYLRTKNRIVPQTIVPLLSNQLAIIAPMDQANAPTISHVNTRYNFAASFQGRLCTGDMQSVPSGKYAKQALRALGWLDVLQPRLVQTSNVRSALAMVEQGQCARGIVYRSDVVQGRVKLLAIIPSHLHQPIVYSIAQTRPSQAASQFLNYVTHSSAALQLYPRYGFTLLQSVQLKPSASSVPRSKPQGSHSPMSQSVSLPRL